MTKALCFRLAMRNLRRGRQTWLPFLMASSLLTFALYSFCAMTFNPGLNAVFGAETFMLVLNLGLIVVGLFTAIFLFYANAFLIRRRKKELGLYSILGMERRHVVRVLFHELAMAYGITMAFGLGLGMLLSRLLFLVLRALMRLDIPLADGLNAQAAMTVAALIGALFLLLFLYNAIKVRASKPVDLLHGAQQGEKEPRARWLLSVLGLVCMGAGYYMAAMVNNPVTAVALFFVAVVLVIAGTYLLFLTGSIALLKMLKRNKRFYYSPKHFATVSGMLYRMKQNAAGLASITILCTMAMVTIGTTGALYIGSEKMLDEQYLADVAWEVETEAQATAVIKAAHELEAETGMVPKEHHVFRSRTEWMYFLDGECHNIGDAQGDELDYYDRLVIATVMTQEDYNALQGTSLSLAADEIAWWGDQLQESLRLAGQTWRVVPMDAPRMRVDASGGSGYRKAVVVVPDEATVSVLAHALLTKYGKGNVDEPLLSYTLTWDLTGTEEEKLAFAEKLMDDGKAAMKAAADENTSWGYKYSSKVSAIVDWYALYGSFLFVGVFLGLIFLMGTALIIYFKQVSEGYQDHDRYIIMQKVGMSQQEVKRTVRKQILLVFFLPLLVALCHVGGSLHMVALMLCVFGLTDVPFIAGCTVFSAVLVALLYFLFYHRTAATYFRLVRFDDGGK